MHSGQTLKYDACASTELSCLHYYELFNKLLHSTSLDKYADTFFHKNTLAIIVFTCGESHRLCLRSLSGMNHRRDTNDGDHQNDGDQATETGIKPFAGLTRQPAAACRVSNLKITIFGKVFYSILYTIIY